MLYSRPDNSRRSPHYPPRWKQRVQALSAASLLGCLALTGLPTGTSRADGIGTDAFTAQAIISTNGVPVGRVDANQVIRLAIGLAVDTARLDPYLQTLYNPTSPIYKRYLTPAQFTARFIDAGARAGVDTYLTKQGLQVADKGIGPVIDVSGTAGQIEAAFHLDLNTYRDGSGQFFYANDRTPALPQSLAPAIAGVVGLNSRVRSQPRFRRPEGGPNPTPVQRSGITANTPPICTYATTLQTNWAALSDLSKRRYIYDPAQLRTAYNIKKLKNSGYTGQGQTVALYELDGFDQHNIDTFQNCYNLHVPIDVTSVDGGVPQPPGAGQVEVELDIEAAAGIAPGLDHIQVYEAPNSDTGVSQLDNYAAIAIDDTASTISTSWGFCERAAGLEYASVENSIFRQMAAQGQTVFSASGDYGSEGCFGFGVFPGNPDPTAPDAGDPSSPFITTVGGTSLALSNNNVYSAETVWNRVPDGGGSGGGISTLFYRPWYQSGDGITGNMRLLPDVSADADPHTGYLIYTTDPDPTFGCGRATSYSGDPNTTTCFEPIGGTSAAAPLWAGVAAVVDGYLLDNGGNPLGFANPALYAIYRSKGHASSFHDILPGLDSFGVGEYSNCQEGPDCGSPNTPNSLYPVTPGYDMATGIGSPDGAHLAEALLDYDQRTFNACYMAIGVRSGGTSLGLRAGWNIAAARRSLINYLRVLGSDGLVRAIPDGVTLRCHRGEGKPLIAQFDASVITSTNPDFPVDIDPNLSGDAFNDSLIVKVTDAQGNEPGGQSVVIRSRITGKVLTFTAPFVYPATFRLSAFGLAPS